MSIDYFIIKSFLDYGWFQSLLLQLSPWLPWLPETLKIVRSPFCTSLFHPPSSLPPSLPPPSLSFSLLPSSLLFPPSFSLPLLLLLPFPSSSSSPPPPLLFLIFSLLCLSPIGPRKVSKKLRSLSLELDTVPTLPEKAWRVRLKDCFTEQGALLQALRDISTLNEDLSQVLSNSSSASPPPSFFTKYQEYLDAFICLFVQSKMFVGRGASQRQTPEPMRNVLSSLSRQKCPSMSLFRRLVVNPASIADDDAESSEMLVIESKSIPVTQLARMCDVSVLRFLSSVTEKTDPRSIVWALDYLTEMTQRLDLSLRAQSEMGWCGIRFRKRKDTIRRSVIEAPKLALDGRPLVIGIGAPQVPMPGAPILGPDTEWPNPSPIPSILLSEDEGEPSPPQTGRRRRTSRDESSSVVLPYPNLPIFDATDGDQQQKSSREQPQRRRSSVTAPPNIVAPELPQRRSSTGSNPFLSSGPPPVRKTSAARPSSPLTVIETIVEEEPCEAPRSSNLDAVREVKPPDVLDLHHTRAVSPHFNPRSSPPFRSPSPSLLPSSLLEDRRSPEAMSEPKKILSSSDDDDDEEEEEEVKRKEERALSPLASTGKGEKGTSPSPSTSSSHRLTPDLIEKELFTLVTSEGRISLLALLQAISHLPSTLSDLWTEDSWDACHKCFQLIQFCMDFGLDTSQHKSSGDPTNKKALFHKHQDKESCTNLEFERPARTYSRLVLQHSLDALIHCAISMYTGCSSDNCRLGAFSIQRSRGAGQILNKMIHQLERLYSNSSLHFREAAMAFAQQAPCRQVFHFLHVILQYCPKGPGRDPLDPSSSKRDPMIVLTAAMLRILVDRLNQLDLYEQTIQQVCATHSYIHV